MSRKQTNKQHLSRTGVPADYASLLTDIKQRIRSAQIRAAFSANAELIRLYWDIGRAIEVRQRQEGWGAGVIPRLAHDLHNEIPDVRGFSERNLKRMIAFYRAYREHDLQVPQPVALSVAPLGPASSDAIVPQAVAQWSADDLTLLPPATAISHVPWGHHILLIERVKDLAARFWYMRQTLAQGWSRSVLAMMIDARAHERQGKAITNFDRQLPPPQSDLAAQAIKDPYIFDFLTLAEPFHERELETGLLAHVEKFLLELGQDKNRLVAEYALKGVNKAIGVSEYRLTRALPKELKSSLPSIEEIEAELSTSKAPRRSRKRSH